MARYTRDVCYYGRRVFVLQFHIRLTAGKAVGLFRSIPQGFVCPKPMPRLMSELWT